MADKQRASAQKPSTRQQSGRWRNLRESTGEKPFSAPPQSPATATPSPARLTCSSFGPMQQFFASQQGASTPAPYTAVSSPELAQLSAKAAQESKLNQLREQHRVQTERKGIDEELNAAMEHMPPVPSHTQAKNPDIVAILKQHQDLSSGRAATSAPKRPSEAVTQTSGSAAAPGSLRPSITRFDRLTERRGGPFRPRRRVRAHETPASGKASA